MLTRAGNSPKVSLLVSATLFFALAVPLRALADTVSFTSAGDYRVGDHPQCVALGDFNRDGVRDLAISNAATNDVSVLLGNGNGTFQAPRAFPTGGGPTAVVVGDFNGDGIQDLATTDSQANTISLLMGIGDGTFTAPVSIPAGGSNPNFAVVADFNGDGFPDLGVATWGGSASTTVSVLLGNGNGTFQSARTFAVQRGPLWITAGDFNGDGRQDLAVANFNNDSVSVLLGNGDGNFQPARNFPAPGAAVVKAGDFNRDGRQDLAVADYFSNRVWILLGNGDGTFQPGQSFDVGVGPVDIATGDFNGDGAQDLAVPNWDRNSGRLVSVLLGNGDGTFQPAQNLVAGAGVVAVAVEDFNADGRQDVAVANYNWGTLSVFLNSTVSTQYTLTVTKGGTGGGTVTSSPAGIDCGPTCSAPYTGGTAVTLTAAPASDSGFTGWSGAGCSGTGACTVTMSAATTVTATFDRQRFLLTVAKSGTGTGTVTSSPAGIDCGATCSASYDSGTVVTLTASPAGGATFTGWSGGGCSGTGACNVAVTAATTVTATFGRQTFTLSVGKAGTGTGTVSSTPPGIDCGPTCSASYDSGTLVTLSASAGTGSTFKGWSGGGCSGTGNCTVPMSAATTATATFDLQIFTLTVTKESVLGVANGTVTSSPAGIDCGGSCSAPYNYGTTITLTARPDSLSAFDGWSGGGCSGTGTCTVSLPANTTVTARFKVLGVI